jgi:GNAT superfamily N-acetyltransferase
MSQNLSVRPATVEDIPSLNDVLFRAFDALLRDDYPPEVLERAVPMMGRARPELVASGTYFVAVDAEGNIVGAGGWTAEDPATGRAEAGVGHIRHFAVDPAAARRGVAKAIMAKVLGAAAAAGFKRLECYSTRSARKFYEATGFEVAGPEVEVNLGEGIAFSSVPMRRGVA